MHHFWRRLRRAERGATAIEYGLILACIAMALVGALRLLNERTGNLFGNAVNALSR